MGFFKIYKHDSIFTYINDGGDEFPGRLARPNRTRKVDMVGTSGCLPLKEGPELTALRVEGLDVLETRGRGRAVHAQCAGLGVDPAFSRRLAERGVEWA